MTSSRLTFLFLTRSSREKHYRPDRRKKRYPLLLKTADRTGQGLEGKGLELAWLKDPVDVAFLQIQGSGRLDLGQGRATRVGYAEKNGLPIARSGGTS